MRFAETSQRFGVGIASLKRWSKRLHPKPYERRKVRKTDPEKLAQDVCGPPDVSQYECAAGFEVCQKSIWQALRKLGVTHKKALRPPKANAAKRRAFCQKVAAHQVAGWPIVSLDESGFATDIPRPHGSAPRGTRCFGVQNRNARGRETVIGARLAGALRGVGLKRFQLLLDHNKSWKRSQS